VNNVKAKMIGVVFKIGHSVISNNLYEKYDFRGVGNSLLG